jgi:hypothetical protein
VPTEALAGTGGWGLMLSPAMTSTDSLSLILRRLDEIERKLNHMPEEPRTPTAMAIRFVEAIFQ